MNARRAVKTVAVGAGLWIADAVLFAVAFVGCLVGGFAAMRIWQDFKGITVTSLPIPDQALFFAGAIVFVAATGGRLWLKSPR